MQIGKRVKVHRLAEVDGIEYLNPIVCMHKSISDLEQGRTFRVLSIRIEKKVNYFYEVTTSD